MKYFLKKLNITHTLIFSLLLDAFSTFGWLFLKPNAIPATYEIGKLYVYQQAPLSVFAEALFGISPFVIMFVMCQLISMLYKKQWLEQSKAVIHEEMSTLCFKVISIIIDLLLVLTLIWCYEQFISDIFAQVISDVNSYKYTFLTSVTKVLFIFASLCLVKSLELSADYMREQLSSYFKLKGSF